MLHHLDSNSHSNNASGKPQAIYSMWKTETSENHDVIYYFHGLGGTHNDWHKVSHRIFPEWKKRGQHAPMVVGVSFGSAWFLSADDPKSYGHQMMEYFVHSLIPEVETKLIQKGYQPKRRLLVRGSMGGYNAAQIFLKHPKLFDRVALLSPAFSQTVPYLKEAESPLKKRHQLGPHSPKLFISIGKQDEWGFYEGAKAFSDLAKSQKVPEVHWHPVEGGHHDFDIHALSRFLVSE